MPTFSVALLLALVASVVPAHASMSGNDAPNRRPSAASIDCVQSAVHFDATSIETITLRPESILADVDAFWESDRAYWLVSRWLDEVGSKRPISAWLPWIEQKAKVPAADRGADKSLAVVRELMAGEGGFLESAIPHICSFLPRGASDMSTTVYLTTLIPQNAFQKHYNVVVNISHPQWQRDPAIIMNTIIHELFHVAFYRYEPLLAETQLDDSEKYDILLNLMNEGMATYVAYTARSIYPAAVSDYALLDDPRQVQRLLGEMNTLLTSVDSLPADEFRQRMFNVGVIGRALYIAGAHAAGTIERAGGRTMLLDAMGQGPRAFVSMYNGIAPEGERLVEYALPQQPSPFQRMRQAALAGGSEAMRGAMADVRVHCAAGGEPVGHCLHTTGFLLLHRDALDAAMEIFDLYRELVPGASSPYEGLATACLRLGEDDRAAAMCRELLLRSPGNVAALDMLAQLEETRSPQNRQVE